MRSAGGRRKARATPKPPRSAAKVARQLAELTAELRLRTAERDEALAQQVATAEILRAINASPGDLAPVFDAILDKAMHLCGAAFGALGTWQGERFTMVAMRGGERLAHYLATNETSVGPRSGFARVVKGDGYVQFTDISQSKFYRSGDAHSRALVDLGGARSTLTVPLAREDEVLGLLLFYRQEVQPFSEQEITLVKSFAAQAVIAMENARLLEAVNGRNRDLEQSLERQTATSDILGAIAASPGEAEGTLRKIAETTARLFGAAGVSIRLVEGDEFKLSVGVGRGAKQVSALYEDPATRPTPRGRNLPAAVVGENRQIQIRDLDNLDPEMTDWPGPPVARAAGIRTMIGTPLRSGGRAIGAMTVYREELRPFDDVELQLLQSFADQAVIAIENTRLLTDQREALERQTATADVLQVINSSPGQLTPVFEAMLERATRLCEARFGILWLYEGERFRAGAVHAVPAAFSEFCREPVTVGAGASLVGIVRGDRFVHVADLAVTELYKAGNPLRRAVVDLGGARTLLSVPLRKDDTLLGAFTIYRQEVKPFSDKQIALVQNFAAQAVIAMENARLLGELRQRTGDLQESLEYQTATSDVLKVISRSTFDLQPVLDILAETAGRLCQADYAAIFRRDGNVYRIATAVGYSPEMTKDAQRYQAYLEQHPLVPGRGSVTGRVALEGHAVHVVDTASDSEYVLPATKLGKLRTQLGVPMLREGSPIGVIILGRQRVEAFSQRQIKLVTTFADQAIIAIENARLLSEQHDALERQTATAEVLQVINSSPGDLAPVFEAILEKAHKLCAVSHGSLQLCDGETFRAVAVHGLSEAFADRLRQGYIPGPNVPSRRVIEGARFAHVADLGEIDDPVARAAAELSGIRTTLFIPLRKDGVLLGQIVAARQEVRPFTEKEIALLESFAAQAVIAMENARLITETREALEQQTATAEVLQVINASPGDLTPVFNAMLEKAMRLCEAAFGGLWTFGGDLFVSAALRGVPTAYAEYLRGATQLPGPGTAPYRFFVGGERSIIQNTDLAAEEPYRAGDPQRRALVDLGGARTALHVPLIKDDAVLGLITIYRQEVRPFSDKQIALLQNFAAQAVIAMENARLITETREALEQQTATAEVLQVINASPGDLAPVFDAILEKAHSLCAVDHGSLQLYDGEKFRVVAAHGLYGALPKWMREAYRPGTSHPLRQLLEGARFAHVSDWAEIDDPRARALAESGLRTTLFIPLRKDNVLLGHIGASRGRSEVRPFAEKEIALLENFAAQAVIAMENARLITETREALEQQTATTEILQVINRSPGELAPVFDAMLEKATRLCGAGFGTLWIYDGKQFTVAATHAVPVALAEFVREPVPVAASASLLDIVRGQNLVHMPDMAATELYDAGNRVRRAYVDLGGARTLISVALRKDNTLLGAFNVYRQEVRPFSDKEIALVQNFAAQAVIAIENARLMTETREALEQQTATAEILQVINSSPGELAPVFDAILEKGHRLCGVAYGSLQTYDGEWFRAVAVHDLPEQFANLLRRGFRGSDHPVGRAFLAGERLVHLSDCAEIDHPVMRSAVELAGIRTALFVPLRRDEALLGMIVSARREVKPFTEKEIALLESFAAQAVIAMENARLLNEIRHRNAALAEALEFQTATGEVLRIVASSPDNLQSVFDAMLEKATALCEAKFGTLFLYDSKAFTVAADRNLPPAYAEVVRGHSFSPETNIGFRRLVESKAPVHVRDTLTDDSAYAEREPVRVAAVELGGVRSFLAVPMLKKGELIGNFSIYRDEPGGFAENQVALVTTFADQAVIAIENARLFGELRERQAELARSVDELTATGDVLKIISRSSVELETVLDTLVETVARLCRADQANMFRQRDGKYHLVAAHGLSQAAKEFLLTHPVSADRGTMSGRVQLERRVVHIPDALADPEYAYLEGQKIQGHRTMLGIPLLREDAMIGIFAINRTRVEPFATKEIELATTFADQAVIAIENARLFEELRERQAELRVTFDNMGDGVAMFDADRRLAAWNRNLQEMLELPNTFLAERPSYAELFRYLAERGEFGSADLKEELRRNLEDTTREMRYERTRPDGRVIEVRRNPVPGGGFVLIYADITERKRAEEAIHTARDAAETALRELQTAQASLLHSQKMAALGQLTAGIAHEIKNPLNFVNNFAGLSNELLTELKEVTAPAMARLDLAKRAELDETFEMLTGNLNKIIEHGRRADGIVRSMLAHSRGGSGDWQSADLNALVEEALNLAYHGARAQDQSFNITMERDLDRNLAPIEVVPQDVTRVFLNLIGNGFYAANKRKRDADAAFRPVLQVATRDLGDTVEIRVRDNGIGITPEYRERLFQPFFTTKPTGEGTGLGLSISYDIITQQHGGAISVDSEVGSFTEFTVRLPRRRHVATAGRSA
jgi:PAS domain S-box-containing protein